MFFGKKSGNGADNGKLADRMAPLATAAAPAAQTPAGDFASLFKSPATAAAPAVDLSAAAAPAASAARPSPEMARQIAEMRGRRGWALE
jgi:hypothetical protein